MTTPEPQSAPDFSWTEFYEGFADALLKFKGRQSDLVQLLVGTFGEMSWPFTGLDPSRLAHIDPFSVMASFNRGPYASNETRMSIAAALSRSLEVHIGTPNDFDGIPTLFANGGSWFYKGGLEGPSESDANIMWDIFERAIETSKQSDIADHGEFIASFDKAIAVTGVKHTKLSMGLFWIRPREFIALDKKNIEFMERTWTGFWAFGNKKPNGAQYLEFRDKLRAQLAKLDSPVQSFQSLSHAAEIMAKTGKDPSIPEYKVPRTSDPSPEEERISAPHKAKEAERRVWEYLRAEYGEDNVVPYCLIPQLERKKLEDRKLPGADFSLHDQLGGPAIQFIEVKSSLNSRPDSIRLTKAEFERAKNCTEETPYEVWVVIFQDNKPTLWREEHFERHAKELTIEELTGMSVRLDYSDKVNLPL